MTEPRRKRYANTKAMDAAKFARRKAERLGVGGDHPDWHAYQALMDQPCAYCFTNPSNGVDHVVPLVQGGPNSLDNIVPSCWECNHSKGGRTPEQWLAGERGRRRRPLRALCPYGHEKVLVAKETPQKQNWRPTCEAARVYRNSEKRLEARLAYAQTVAESIDRYRAELQIDDRIECMTADRVMQMRALAASGLPAMFVAEIFGVSRSLAHDCITGKTWAWVPGKPVVLRRSRSGIRHRKVRCNSLTERKAA